MLVIILIYAILSNIKKMQIGFGKLKDAMLVIIFGPFGIEITNVSSSIMFDSFT